MKIILFIFFISIKSFSSDFKSHFFINGKAIKHMKHAMIQANKPTLIEVFFSDPRTKKIYKDFKIMHGKYMHMVVANKDLSIFKHVHPYFDPITGRFSITLNMPYADPDNIDAIKTFERPGMYMVMTDVIVRNVGMRMDHAMVHVMGESKKEPLILDSSSKGAITKYFSRSNESSPSYKTIFSTNQISGCSGNIVNFEVEVFYYKNGRYEPLLEFQPWLSEAAHAVWLSENYMSHMHHKMPFAHMHSNFILDGDEDETNDKVYDHILRFNFHDQDLMLAGKQKIWVQFKHLDKIMKIPFIFEYLPLAKRDC